MRTEEESSLAHWKRVLTSGGFTAIPRWVQDPRPGQDEHRARIPHDVARSLEALNAELGVSRGAVMLAAHARVLATLSGESRVVTGYVAADGGSPLPCRVVTENDSWLDLIREAERVVTDLLPHMAYPVANLRSELGLTERPFEVVLDPTGTVATLPAETVLCVGLADSDRYDGMVLRYDGSAIDEEYVARIAGYHVAALEAMTADPSAAHARHSLLSAAELEFLIEGLRGPRRELPDRRVHELFEERVRAHPDVIAAVQGERAWTYRELNARANVVARALQVRGVGSEDVVAVVTERNLDWMAAVLAVFKAGGVYLPIEPHFPAERIAAMLSRSDCALVLTEPESATHLDEALDSLPGVQVLHLEAAYAEGHADDDLGVAVGPDHLAYIYFTSGSTGTPKGAMCEHGGMLNHIFAKIDDLGIEEGQVVAQVAPQCFDISLWQLVAALLVGGRTLIVEQDVILDVERFVDTIATGEVAVLQVVPSYLEVVLSYLDQYTGEMPDLRIVSVTGEALTRELTERWFAAMPGIELVNAYGLTETSDDTNHEVMDRPPDGDRVPLGRAINNVYVYVVDEHLSPVPLGAPGEIVFSGICVGRGYINDPERTALAYVADPIRHGERLYRSGDYGRWRPDGKLEFLGRRDAQVKIRGFRIEIGDIENALLRVPGVRSGAVVVAEPPDRSKHLVAFYTGHRPLEVVEVQEQVGRAVPDYMIPSIFHWRKSLPLTGNGKIDRKKLRALAAELDTAQAGSQPPATPTEERLAAAWAKVLGIPADQLGRQDNFFDRGGTSLSAVRLAVELEREVSLKDVTRHPILADLAGLVDGRTARDSELLHQLAEPDVDPIGVLVCFPYAGGNAVNFQPMAGLLRDSGLAVYAVELPGHDLAAESERFAPLHEVVDQVAGEIRRRGLSNILLWGHSAGAAFALATAHELRRQGVGVVRVFVGAQLLGEAGTRRTAIGEVTAQSDAEIAAWLSADTGYSDLGDLDAQRAAHVGAAFRHDFVSANRYLAEVMDDPPAERLHVPVTVVVAADDPLTAGYHDDYRGWELLAGPVDLYELGDGGHYFLRTHPAESVEAVLTSLAPLPSSVAASH